MVMSLAADMSAAKDITINDFSLTLEDKSLLDRAFKLAAEMQGMEPAQLRAMATGMLGMATMQAGQSGAMGGLDLGGLGGLLGGE